MRSFAQLEEADTVTPTELEETLKEYVDGGWAISARATTNVIRKANPNHAEKMKLIELAKQGAVNQQKRGCTKEVDVYTSVANYLLRIL